MSFGELSNANRYYYEVQGCYNETKNLEKDHACKNSWPKNATQNGYRVNTFQISLACGYLTDLDKKEYNDEKQGPKKMNDVYSTYV